MDQSHVIDVSDETFEAEVIQTSHRLPVVVDFWAPWCGPCRTLGPLLEGLAQDADGAFRLAKLDIDQSPEIARSLAVQSIPFVVAFRDGEIVNQFVGAQPESVVRQFLERILPDEADHLAAEGSTLAAAGDLEAAEVSLRSALAQRPHHPGATLGLARLLADSEREEEASSLLETIVAAGETATQIEQLAAELRMRRGGDADETALRRELENEPGDLTARLALGRHLATKGRNEEALALFLEVVRRDPEFEDAAARKAMLDIFTLLGNDDPLVDDYRRRLSQVLYS